MATTMIQIIVMTMTTKVACVMTTNLLPK
jgi:hypothetical protein